MKESEKSVVIIVNWNGKHFLNDCLTAVMNQSCKNFKVVFVDNGSTDGSIEYVSLHFPLVDIVRLDRNTGFAYANNVAMESAINNNIDYIALLNNDTKADEKWLEMLIKAMQKNPNIGICASKMLLMSHPQIIDSTGHIFNEGKISDRGQGEVDYGQYDDKSEVIGACAGACLYRRKMLEDIGLFDGSFITYYEDAELSWRAHKKGWLAKFVPESIVLHHHSGTIKSHQNIDRRMFEEQYSINIAKMIRKHGTFWQKIRNSYAWVKMALRAEFQKRVSGCGDGGKLFLDRLKILWR